MAVNEKAPEVASDAPSKRRAISRAWAGIVTATFWLADHINLFASFVVLAAGACLLVPLFISDSDRAISFVLLAMLFVSFSFIVTLFAAIVLMGRDSRLYLRQILYQSAAFVVLAFSLRAFGMHEAVATALRSILSGNTSLRALGQAGETIGSPRSVAELSSIMILFILIEISAFVARDVEEAKSEVSKATNESKDTVEKVERVVASINKTAEQIGQLKLVASVAALDQEVMEAAIDLISLWANRAPNAGLRPNISRDSTVLADHCWRVLMREYLREERKDFVADISAVVPPSVRPLGVSGKDYQSADVSYIATNVGFYATYLSQLVTELQSLNEQEDNKNRDKKKVCIAVVTNVLPAHWWNWTFTINEWRAYEAITTLRDKMVEISGNGAHVDRLIAVWSDVIGDQPSYQPHGTLWPQSLLNDMLTRWYRIHSNGKDDTLPSSTTFPASTGMIGNELARFPPPVVAGACSGMDGARIYPMIRRGDGEAAKTYSARSERWEEELLADAYGKLHGGETGAGKYWALPINEANIGSFKGHFDAMFIGIGPQDAGNSDSGLWADGERVDWGVCLMNSADAAVETMFLTVISGRSAGTQFAYWRDQILKNQISFSWTDNRLRKENRRSRGEDGS